VGYSGGQRRQLPQILQRGIAEEVSVQQRKDVTVFATSAG
jgi:hypothetical protein